MALSPRGGKRKGDKYEREVAAYLNEYLPTINAFRAPLSGGGRSIDGAGDADVIGVPELHLELKRTERLNVRDALKQAEASVDSRKSPDIPVVVTRRNKEPTGDSLVVLRLDDFIRIYKEFLVRDY